MKFLKKQEKETHAQKNTRPNFKSLDGKATKKKKKHLFYRRMDLPSRVGRSGGHFLIFIYLFIYFFYYHIFLFLVAKMTLKTQKFTKK